MAQRILLISYFSPARAHAGGVRLLDLYREIRRIQPHCHLVLLACQHKQADWGQEAHPDLFDATYFVTSKDFTPKKLAPLIDTMDEFDIIDLHYHPTGRLIPLCKKRWPQATIIYSVMESLLRATAIRLATKEAYYPKNMIRVLANIRSAYQELRFVRAADTVVCVSDADLNILARATQKTTLTCIPTCLSHTEFPIANTPIQALPNTPPSVVFIAYFGSQTNRDALVWYCRHVHPQVLNAQPDYTLKVVGRGLDDDLKKICSLKGITLMGAVDDLIPVLSSAHVGIAPAIYGAGIRGKIHQYAALGIPCVASSIAHASLKYQPGVSIMSAPHATAFCQSLLALLSDEALRLSMGTQAKQVCLTHYQWGAVHQQISHVYSLTSNGVTP